MRKLSLIFLSLATSLFTIAQTARTYTSSEILQQLKKINVLGSVLYVAAHPDDENTRLLAYLANEKLYRTGYLSLTRGDGGQNLIGNEQGVELGLIRTQELLSARRIDGAEQFFSRAFDFGFSKSSQEALSIWGHDKILSDVVWVIRKFRPDVIIVRFPEDSRAGHGHHAASAILAREAFDAAADPSKFPEQFKYGVTPWKARRLLWNTFSFGNTNTQSEDQFKIDVGMYNPLLGRGYGEIAALSRSQHKSQGFGVAAQRGAGIEYFVTVKGDTPSKDLMDGVDISWSRLSAEKGGSSAATDESIRQAADSVISNFEPEHPEKSVPALVRLYHNVKLTGNGYWQQEQLPQILKAIEFCSGLYLEATVNNAFIYQGEPVNVTVLANNRLGVNITDAKIQTSANNYTPLGTLNKNANVTASYSITTKAGDTLMQPYWLKAPMDKGSFTVSDQQMIGKAENDPVSADIVMNIEGESFHFSMPVRYKYTDPVKGEMFQPLLIVPANTPVEKELNANVRLKILNGDKKSPHSSLASAGSPPPAHLVLRTINYDHIPRVSYFYTDSIKEVALDLKITGKKVGYIEGAGDKIVPALREMGYDVTVLSDKDLASADLSVYQAIIAGVRAYNVRESLNSYYDRLMKYIENGGNLIVQYNTSNQLGSVKAKIGPYPFNISRTRVTEENAVVTILHPDHPLLNFPNKIVPKDFDGWVQERSIYHAQDWDNHYQTIFSMHDTGEKDDEGSLIMAKYGKGNFVYTGLVFYRELPAGVAGSYRLLANIIALK